MDIDYKVSYIGRSYDELWRDHNKWRVKLTNPANGKTFTTTFHTGIGIKGAPTKEMVLNALASDMEYCGYDGYFDFVRNMGLDYYDKDAKAIYRKMQRIYDRWMRVFGEPIPEEFCNA